MAQSHNDLPPVTPSMPQPSLGNVSLVNVSATVCASLGGLSGASVGSRTSLGMTPPFLHTAALAVARPLPALSRPAAASALPVLPSLVADSEAPWPVGPLGLEGCSPTSSLLVGDDDPKGNAAGSYRPEAGQDLPLDKIWLSAPMRSLIAV